MSIFDKKKRDEDYDEEEFDEYEDVPKKKKFKDLKPENKKKRKEPVKPWGKKERLLILVVFLVTIFVSGVLSLSARNFKLPGLPRISLPSFNWGGETIVIEGNKEGREKANKVLSFFEETTKKLSGLYALYVIRLSDGTDYGVNENETMQAASLIKLPIMTFVFKKGEEGEIDLDEVPTGGKSTYRELLIAMGKRSDNSAQVLLVKTFGEAAVEEYIDEIGMENTSLAENETTPYDIGVFFGKLWKEELISKESRDEILDNMTDTIYEDWIARDISVRVAHKYGREVHVVNDAGIIFSEKPFVLVLMSDGAVESEADEALPTLAKRIYEIETGK
jgi:beta-lactamase class A